MIEMRTTLSSWPQLASDVVLGGASATVAIRTLVLGQPLPSGRRFVDLHRRGDAPATARARGCHRRATVTHPGSGQAHPDRADDVPAEILRVVEHAVLAPSGGNVQPWHLHWDGERLWVSRDAVRARSVLDGRGHGALLALGAAVENAVIAAAAEGAPRRSQPFPLGDACDVVAAIGLEPGDVAALEPLAALAPLVRERCTDRRPGRRRSSPRTDLDAIAAAAREHGADVQFRTEPAALDGARPARRCVRPDPRAVRRDERRGRRRAALDAGAGGADPRRDHGVERGPVGERACRGRPRHAPRRGRVPARGRRWQPARGRTRATPFAGASAAGLLTLRRRDAAGMARGRAGDAARLAGGDGSRPGLSPDDRAALPARVLDDPRSPAYTAAERSTLRSLEQRLYRVFDRPRGRRRAALSHRARGRLAERSLRMPAPWILSAGRPPA